MFRFSIDRRGDLEERASSGIAVVFLDYVCGPATVSGALVLPVDLYAIACKALLTSTTESSTATQQVDIRQHMPLSVQLTSLRIRVTRRVACLVFPRVRVDHSTRMIAVRMTILGVVLCILFSAVGALFYQNVRIMRPGIR